MPRLREGGVLAYVTCSPHLAETKAVVQRVLKHCPQLRQLPAGDLLADIAPELERLEGRSVAQLWPHRDGTDAMFISLFERVK